MAKSKPEESVSDFNKYIEVSNRLKRKQQDQKKIIALGGGLAYIVTILIFFSFFQSKFFNFALLFPFVNDSNSTQTLKEQLRTQQITLNTLQTQIAEIQKSSTSSSAVNAEIEDIRNKQEAIEQTILIDPDKAITAPLLRQKQTELDSKISRLQTQVDGLSSLLWYIFTGIILLPIVGIGWGFFGDKIKNKLGAKQYSEF